MTIPQTGFTTPVPAVYSTPAERQGSIVWITYDSEDHLNGNAPVQKRASVYLPYSYDENDAETRYDILYLMHGWGGSAGARMAAWLGSYGTAAFGEAEYPRPAAVIMQYTGLGEVLGDEPPTYNCVGASDGIASCRTMERRIAAIQANGTDAMIEVFPGLSHGFGLGTGTVAEGWIDNAAAFWERNMDEKQGGISS